MNMGKTTYYFAETQDLRCHIVYQNFKEIQASNEIEAMKIAYKNSIFQGTAIQVFYAKDENSRFAYKIGKGRWKFDKWGRRDEDEDEWIN